MVGIVSKRSWTRREDIAARRLIETNRGLIERLADQISQGAYSASRRAAPAEPEPEGLLIHDLGTARAVGSGPRPYVRVSPNRRVVVADLETGRHLHHLGEIRRLDGAWRFVVATPANGFLAPVEPDIAERLAPLDLADLGEHPDDAALARAVAAHLGYDQG